MLGLKVLSHMQEDMSLTKRLIFCATITRELCPITTANARTILLHLLISASILDFILVISKN